MIRCVAAGFVVFNIVAVNSCLSASLEDMHAQRERDTRNGLISLPRDLQAA